MISADAGCADALPQDRMGDAQVRADEHDHVGLLEVGVGVRRRVEAERLLVGDDRRWPCTAACCRRRAACPCRTWRARRAAPFPRWRSARCSGRRPTAGRARAWIALMRSTNVSSAVVPVDRLAAGRRRLRSSGVVARSGASSTASAPPSPWGRPCRGSPDSRRVGVRLTASPSCRWTSRPQPVEQKPQTIGRRGVGLQLRGHLAQPEAARVAAPAPAVSGPCARAAGRARARRRLGTSAVARHQAGLPASWRATTAAKNR